MAEAMIDDFEDLLTCSVCLENFDNEVRKPKFLSCHHTLCLECVKSMGTQMLVTCPLCRKETYYGDNKYGLPNNNYVLQMIASQSRNMIKIAPSQQIPNDSPLVKKRWCLKCRKDSSDLCNSLSGHDTILASSSEFCSEMLKSKDNNETQMATIIEDRREAKSYLTRILDSLKIVEDEIKQLEEDNDDHLVKMISLLEDAGKTASAKDETAESFSERVNQCTELIKQELEAVKRFKDSYLDRMKNTTIFVQFKDQEGKAPPYGFPPFDTGFSPAGRAGQQIMPKNLEVASHILLSLLKPKENPMNNKFPPQAILHQPKRSVPRIEHHQAASKKLDFTLSFNCLNNKDSSLGSVFIKPDNRFYQHFIEALSHVCTEPVKKIPAKLIMGVASQYVIIEFGSSSGFQMTVQSVKELMTVHPFDRNREEQSLDVRLIGVACQGNTITSFKLGFMFNRLQNTTTITRESHPLLGRIVKGKWVLERMIDFDRIREFTHVRIGKHYQEFVPRENSLAVKPKKTNNNTLPTALDPSLLIRVDPNQIQNLKIQNGDLFISLNQSRTRNIPNAIKTVASSGRSGQPMQEYIPIIINRNSVFAMTFTRRNRNIGTILLKPDKNFYRPFIEGLAWFCQSPMIFSGQIEKAHPTFVTFEFSHTNFRQNVPNPRNFMNDSSHCDVENALEVGLFDYNYEGRSVTDFQLMFLLEPYNPDHMKECTRFGKVVSGEEILEQLSQKRMNERDNFTISIEFRQL